MLLVVLIFGDELCDFVVKIPTFVFMCSLFSPASFIYFIVKFHFFFLLLVRQIIQTTMPNFGLIYLRLILLFHLI